MVFGLWFYIENFSLMKRNTYRTIIEKFDSIYIVNTSLTDLR